MTATEQPLCPLDILPVELFASILSELDLASLISASTVSSLFRSVIASPLLNPWRQPIRRVLLADEPYPPEFSQLGARLIVPRHNWIEILALARLEWILLSATVPSLPEQMWEEAFNRRWLPGMRKWKKLGNWQEAYKRTAMRIWHRLNSSCTSDESWCRYVVLNRNGSANLCEAYSRTFNPLAVFDEFKLQANLMHLETQVRLVVQFLDIRVIALGVLHHSSSLFVNSNARQLLHPPGVQSWIDDTDTISDATEAFDIVPSISSQRSPQVVTFAPQSLPNPYTPVLLQTAGGVPLHRAESNESTGSNHAPGRGVPFRRTMSNEANGRAAAGNGIFRRLTVSFGDRIFGGVSNDAGPSSPTIPGPVLGRSASHQPVHSFSTAPRTNGHTLPPSTSAPLAVPAIASSSSTYSTTNGPVSPSLAPPSGELLYPPLKYPTPVPEHRNYPNYTPSGSDNRWSRKGTLWELDEGGMLWAGPMMIVAQLVHPDNARVGEALDLTGQGRWAAFTTQDLFALAPWMEERVTKVVDGMGLGVF
ncbi:hypothetical protein CALVIDRAFT_562484 [Calocera viscosa TUFC12733]|uniref:F-box domain-containing protein n=1 Tax=Calocera viscosa (strain TUFC12733) TaxID=1330018 RepID=A0A167NUM2_CALVF|nr:hypothetical protein CALVIDRAFT_562484 [Calocera viscosa TUFC12733]